MNWNPKKGTPPPIPSKSATHRLISTLLRMDAPVLHEVADQIELTIGQVRMLKQKQITVIMRDDLGKYELVEGPEMRVVKRRI